MYVYLISIRNKNSFLRYFDLNKEIKLWSWKDILVFEYNLYLFPEKLNPKLFQAWD